MAKKYYFVKSGRQTGLFDNWKQTEASVKGFAGALYCGFADEIAARAFAAANGNKAQAVCALKTALDELETVVDLAPVHAPAIADTIADTEDDDLKELLSLLDNEVSTINTIIDTPEGIATANDAKNTKKVSIKNTSFIPTDGFIPTNGQKKLIDKIPAFLNSNYTAILLAGFAGTGKTTLAKIIAKMVEMPCVCMAFTNKAAGILAKKMGDAATCGTINHFVYDFDEETHQNRLNGLGFPQRSIIFVDECSMICDERGNGTKMISDLLLLAKNHKSKIIFMGDPFQLPPVSSGAKTIWEFNLPTFWLTEVMRQKEESVLAMATTCRSVKSICMLKNAGRFTTFGKICQASKSDLFADYCKKFPLNSENQIGIVWKNDTRLKLTREVRQALGQNNILGIGEPIISIANSDDMSNGDMTIVKKVKELSKKISLSTKDGKTIECYALEVNGINTLFIPAADKSSIYHQSFDSSSLGVLPKEFVELRGKYFSLRNEVVIATYGYFITAHKAQGGEWSRVYVFETPISFNQDDNDDQKREYAARGFYTAITRTSDVLLIANELGANPYRRAQFGSSEDMIAEMRKYLQA